MESSVQTEQTLLAELVTLRARVADLEQTLQHLHPMVSPSLLPQPAEQQIEQKKEANDVYELLEDNKRMDEFLSIASHELRTPLTTINGNIQLAKRRLKVMSTSQVFEEETINNINFVQELLSRAERQVRVQNRLVGDLLDVSRIQANRLELTMSNCDLVEILREEVEDQRSAAPSRLITLDVPYATAIPIKADRDRIGQVITNYLTNALKYSASDRPVEVQTKVEGQLARVSVRDKGPGLPPEEQVRLWRRFYRVPNITVLSGTGVGLGLGLHICKTIVELHSGQVGVESVPKQGSTFWFTLPTLDHTLFDD
ncbi:MAG TPA: HAMP domain-containing sensor histidine kinase [Ktedonobacteraceae bacterium]|nr:HAMP domain-containing sensor histidine kinase [Ktedonobacteraceae bacterium]